MKYTNRQTESIFLVSLLFAGFLGVVCAALSPDRQHETAPAITDLAADTVAARIPTHLDLHQRATKLNTP